MTTRLGLIIAALLLGSGLIGDILLAGHYINEQNNLLFWLGLTLLWGLWAWRIIVIYHRSK